jgi:hypothetical protein
MQEVQILLNNHILREEMTCYKLALHIELLPNHFIFPMRHNFGFDIILKEIYLLNGFKLLNFLCKLPNGVKLIFLFLEVSNSSEGNGEVLMSISSLIIDDIEGIG